MVKGLDTFRNHFAGYEEQYVLIGGAACDIVAVGTLHIQILYVAGKFGCIRTAGRQRQPHQ